MRVRWSNIFGDTFEGVVVEIDSNVFVVKCDDGIMRYVEDGEKYCELVEETDVPD